MYEFDGRDNRLSEDHSRLSPRSGILGEFIGWIGGVRIITLFFFVFLFISSSLSDYGSLFIKSLYVSS